MKFLEVIDQFNEGDTDFLEVIGGFGTFLLMAHRRGLLDKLDANMIFDSKFENEYLEFLHSIGDPRFNELIVEKLNDIKLVNGKPKLILDSRGELAQLFCSDRDISKDTIEEVLDGSYDAHGWSWSDLTDNIYRDVVEELNDENLSRLKEYVIDSLKGVEVSVRTELLNSIAEKQGNEYVIIDQSNIDQIVGDEDTMLSLLDEELDELRSELYSIYENSYVSAYEEELYESIWNEVTDHFEDDGEYTSRPHPYKENTSIEQYLITPSNFYDIVINFIEDNKGYYGYGSTLDYYGSFLGIMENTIDCLRFRVPDYPDSSIVDKNINMYFSDYI
jgi:hypothetical protein